MQAENFDAMSCGRTLAGHIRPSVGVVIIELFKGNIYYVQWHR